LVEVGKGDKMKSKVQFFPVGYLGGYPSWPEPATGQLIADDSGIHMRCLKGALPGLKELFLIPWSEVIEVPVGVAVEGPDAVRRRLTVPRLAFLNIFAFAAKKKLSTTTHLGVHTNSYTCGFELHKTGAGQVRDSLARWTQRLPASAAPAMETTPPAPTPEPAPSVADELAKLVAPQDQGVLSAEELATQTARFLKIVARGVLS